jgi:hypothetical protein
MIDKHHIWIVRELLVFALTAVVLLSVWGRADKHRKAEELQDGRVKFTPNRRSFFGWSILVVYLIFAVISQATHIQGSPLKMIVAVLIAILAVMIAVSFPATIIVASDGLRQVYWLWKNKRVRWEDIVEINAGEKSRIVTITGSDGTKIVHSSVLPDRPRLLSELRHRCGDNLPSDFPREPITSQQDATTPQI